MRDEKVAALFRRHRGTWLDSKRLADELGLYEDALDRLGMLSFDAWRASRLVVDTGLHALGWSRQQARSRSSFCATQRRKGSAPADA